MTGIEAFDEVKRLIVVAAHPDDLECICGGTIALLAERGVDIVSVNCTLGDIGTQEARLALGPPASLDEKELQTTLSAALEQLSVLQPARTHLESNRIDWPGVAASLSNYHDDYMVVLGLTQTDQLLTVQGRAWSEQVVLDYARRLEESGHFATVTVQSLSGNIVPTETPGRGTPTPAPEAPSRIRYVEFTLTAEFKAATP